MKRVRADQEKERQKLLVSATEVTFERYSDRILVSQESENKRELAMKGMRACDVSRAEVSEMLVDLLAARK